MAEENNTQKSSTETKTLSEIATPANEREQLEKLLDNPEVSENKKRNIRAYIKASDYLKENDTIADVIVGDQRMDDETFEGYKDRQRLSKEITRQYLQGEILDNPGGGTYVKEVDGEVFSARNSNKKLENENA